MKISGEWLLLPIQPWDLAMAEQESDNATNTAPYGDTSRLAFPCCYCLGTLPGPHPKSQALLCSLSISTNSSTLMILFPLWQWDSDTPGVERHWYKNKNKKLLLWLAPSTAISFLQTLPCLRWLLSTSLGQSMTKQKQQWSGLLSRHCRTSHASQGLPLEFLLSPAFNKCDCSPTSKAYCWP